VIDYEFDRACTGNGQHAGKGKSTKSSGPNHAVVPSLADLNDLIGYRPFQALRRQAATKLLAVALTPATEALWQRLEQVTTWLKS
jgi:hypothetical protein